MDIQKADSFAVEVFETVYGTPLAWVKREDGRHGRESGAV